MLFSFRTAVVVALCGLSCPMLSNADTSGAIHPDFECITGQMSPAQYQVLDAYLAYYGRPADISGFDYWVSRYESEGASLDAVMRPFAVSQEYAERFGHLGPEALIINLYQQMFNRDPDSEGLAFYSALLASGARTLESIALDIYNGAQGDDLVIRSAKQRFAEHYYYHTVLSGAPEVENTEKVERLEVITAAPDSALRACFDLMADYPGIGGYMAPAPLEAVMPFWLNNNVRYFLGEWVEPDVDVTFDVARVRVRSSNLEYQLEPTSVNGVPVVLQDYTTVEVNFSQRASRLFPDLTVNGFGSTSDTDPVRQLVGLVREARIPMSLEDALERASARHGIKPGSRGHELRFFEAPDGQFHYTWQIFGDYEDDRDLTMGRFYLDAVNGDLIDTTKYVSFEEMQAAETAINLSLAYLGRPAYPLELQRRIQELLEEGDVLSVGTQIAQSSEYLSISAGLDDEELIAKLYAQLRPEPAPAMLVSSLLAAIGEGSINRDSLPLFVLNAVLNPALVPGDVTELQPYRNSIRIQNRADVSAYFSRRMLSVFCDEFCDWRRAEAAAILADVDDSLASYVEAIEHMYGLFAEREEPCKTCILNNDDVVVELIRSGPFHPLNGPLFTGAVESLNPSARAWLTNMQPTERLSIFYGCATDVDYYRLQIEDLSGITRRYSVDANCLENYGIPEDRYYLLGKDFAVLAQRITAP